MVTPMHAHVQGASKHFERKRDNSTRKVALKRCVELDLATRLYWLGILRVKTLYRISLPKLNSGISLFGSFGETKNGDNSRRI
jgi:hypothetical protein